MTFSPDDRASELRDLFFESAEEILQAMNDAVDGRHEDVGAVVRKFRTGKGL